MGVFSICSVDGLLREAGIDANWEPLRAATQPLIDRWGVYWWLMDGYESRYFSRLLDNPAHRILAASRSGAVRWFVDRPHANQWQRTKAPTLNDEQTAIVDDVVNWLQEHPYFDDEPATQWVALRMPDEIALTVDLNAEPIPNNAIQLLRRPDAASGSPSGDYLGREDHWASLAISAIRDSSSTRSRK